MSFFLLFLILSEVLLPNLTCASRVRRQTLKVRISVVGDTVTLRFLQHDTDTKLEGYILGYGSDLFSKQFIQLPEDGEPYETEIDAEPKYLVAVQPAKGEEVKKQCIGKETLDKPLHLVIGSVTSTSVMLSWGTLLNTLTSESNLDDCLEDGHFTVRYREKEPRKKWNYQICPTTDTIIDQLKPETPYEFGVRVESDNIHGAWSPPVIHNTADEDIHNPPEPENNLSPKNPITESSPTFSSSVPVLHIVTPAALLQPPAPPPKQIVPQAKDPEKPGTFRQTKNPITTRPQAFTTSVPVLHNVTQSRPASPHKHPTPPPTQRVTQAIHKPLQPEIFLNPEMPITESPKKFSTSVPSKVNHNPQKTKNTVRPKKPITESPQAFSTSEPGTGSDGIRTSHPSEDSLFLAQTLTSTHAPMSNLKSTNLPQTHDSTIPSLYKTQPQLTTSKTLFSTPKTQSNTAKTVSSTVKTQPNLTEKKTIELHKTIHPQPESSTTKCLFSTSTFQLSSTQFQPHTAKYLLSTAQPKPRSPQPDKINPKTTIKQLQHSTVKGQLKTTQNKFTTLEPITTQSQYIRTQSQSDTTRLQYSTNQSPPHTTQPQSIGIQSETHTTKPQSNIKQSQPHTTQPKPTATQSPPNTPQPQSTASKSQPHTTKSQTNPVKYYPKKILPVSHSKTVHFQPPPTQPQPLKILTQPHITQPQTTTNQAQPHTSQFQTNTIKYHQRTAQHQPITPQSHTSESQPIKTKFNPTMHIEKSQPTTRKNKLTETQSKPRRNKQKHRPSESHKAQPQHTTTQSSTAKYQPNRSSQQQVVTNQYHKYTNKSKFTHKPDTYYQFSPTVEGSTEFQQQPDQHSTSATKKLSNANTRQNGKTGATQISPWGEKKPVNKKLPVSKMGQDLSSTLTASVASTSSTPTVTKRVSPVSIPNPLRIPPTNTTTSVKKTQARYDERLKGQLGGRSPKSPNRKQPEPKKIKEQANQVDKVEGDKVTDLKRVEAIPVLKSSAAPLTTEVYQKPTPTNAPFFAFNGSWYNMGDNSSIFSSVPVSEVDPMGKKRFVAPHVIYKIDKPPEKPCSVTDSLSYFPDEENMVTNISGPPKTPPTNVTVVTVEGCPSFVIVDWEKTDNETTVYEVTSSFPNGQVVSVVQTNQTHAAVENLKPESSYEFTVTPKNELGSGPSSEAVTFSTESADPRVSAAPTGKNAIWSSFSFDADSYSECTGTQYVKRTWYRKFVGIQLCNSLRYKIYLSDSLKGKFYNIGDETGYGEDHCQFVDSFLDGQTGGPIPSHRLPLKQGYFRSMRQEPVKFGRIGGSTQINYVAWYECGVPIPGSW